VAFAVRLVEIVEEGYDLRGQEYLPLNPTMALSCGDPGTT
jgi:hypothetical protein